MFTSMDWCYHRWISKQVPSIVVHNGNTSVPGSPVMDRKVRMQRSLSKQAEFELDGEETLLHLSCNSVVSAPENMPCPSIRNGDALPQELSNCSSQSTERLPFDDNRQPPSHTSSRRNSKVKLLVRSHAVREETSPPPEPGSHSSCNNQINNNNLGVVRPNSRHKLRHQGSSQGSIDSSSPSCLSRDSSMEQYTDSTGIDLTQFIAETLNKNYKDRSFLLRVEQELISLAKDLRRNSHKFPQMSSYQRMLIHRVAAYFGMDHNVDQMGNSVIVNRTKNTRLPETRFKDHIRGELFPEEPRKSILKRDSSSFEDCSGFKSPERQFSSESRRSKSFEEREEEYEKARQRIFNRDGNNGSHDSMQDGSRRSSQEELGWPGDIQPWSSSDSDNSHYFRQRMGFHFRPGRLLKVESFDAHDMSRGNPTRLSVAKSFSFGGYPGAVLSRGDSCSSTHSAGARLLTKQDSGSSMSSRLSPPSSGYKSQSQRSDATLSATPSPVATPVSQLSSQQLAEGQTVMWAVTQLSAVPPGSVLIDPISGQPYVNPDGSVYRYDPNNPPKMGNACASSPDELQLEEQNAIIEECQPEKIASSTSTTCTSPMRHIAPPASTTNSATSPSLPITPPESQPSAAPCSYMPLPAEQTHQPSTTLVPVSMAAGPMSNGSSGTLVAPTPPQQYVSMLPSDVVFGGQQVVYAGSQPAYEQRLPGVNEPNRQMSVTELGGYFMGLNLIDQRGGGDCAMGSYQGYWQPSHQSSPIQSYPAQQPMPMPMYFVPPAPAPAPPPPAATSATPGPQQQTGATQRFVSPVCHPVQQTPHAGSYVSSYPVLGPVLPTAPANADCLQHVMYSPSSINTYYHPVGNGSTQPVLASYQPSQPYRVPTPPCTPTVTQNVTPPFVYVNGGTAGGGGPQTSLVSGLNLFRPAVQMMPGVRTGLPREPKPHYSNRPSSVGDKEKVPYNGERAGRYSSVPMFGLHFLPGAPLQQSPGLRMPFGFNSRSQRYFVNSSDIPGRPPRPRKPRSRLPLTGALNRNIGFPPQPTNNVTTMVPNMFVANHQKTNRINGVP